MGGTRWPAVWAVFAGGLVCGAYIGKVPPALPLQRAELGLSLVESGFIATTFNAIGMAVGMFVGILCDRFGHKRMGLVGLGTLVGAGLLGAGASRHFPHRNGLNGSTDDVKVLCDNILPGG